MPRNGLGEEYRAAVSALLGLCDSLDNPLDLLGADRGAVPGLLQSMRRLAAAGEREGRRRPLAIPRETLSSMGAFADSPVFLGGVHKSGTTLLRHLCDGHESLLVLPVDGGFGPGEVTRLAALPDETRRREVLLHVLKRVVGIGGHVPAALRRLFEEDDEGTSPFERFVRGYAALDGAFGSGAPGLYRTVAGAFLCMEPKGTRGGKGAWVFKSTLNVLDAPELHRIFPRSRFVEIERNPFAVYASQRGRKGMKGRLFSPYYEFECLHRWAEARRENMRVLGPEVYRVIRYEDLVSDSEGVMRQVAAFLDIPFVPRLLQAEIFGFPVQANTGYRELHRRAGKVSRGSVDRWKTVLSQPEKALMAHFLEPPPPSRDLLGAVTDAVRTASLVRQVHRGYRHVEGVRNITLGEAVRMIMMRRRRPSAAGV